VAHETERKSLVSSDAWRSGGEGTRYRQGYLLNSEGHTVRVRLSESGAWLTIKGSRRGLTRPEFEYSIPLGDAEDMLATLCGGSLVEKTRYRVPLGAHLWEVDEFHGANAGLVLAEIELEHEAETFERPEWLGEEVSEDPRYYSGRLSKEPFSSWERRSG
jgi:adenylate cyclase